MSPGQSCVSFKDADDGSICFNDVYTSMDFIIVIRNNIHHPNIEQVLIN